MPVKIRLRRMGHKKQPSYRVVVADSRAPRDGRYVEVLGHYNPLTDPPSVTLDNDRARLWLQRGAQPTEPVVRILVWQGIIPAPWKPKTESTEAEPGVSSQAE
jgi:small subunit ribosomal protein S16